MALSADERKRVEHIQQKMSAFKSQLEKLERYLLGQQVEPINAKLRLDNLVPLYDPVSKLVEELTLLEPENPQLAVFGAVEGRYYDAATAVAKLQAREQPLMNATLNASNLTITDRQDLPRLPKITLPTFDGKRENWYSYKSKFITLIHSRTNISDAVKCSHLFGSLTGSALAKVNQFEPSDTDYPTAWQTLLEFYDHKRVVAVEHLNAILDLPQFTKASADDLSTLWDTATQHLHILKGLDARSGDDFVVRIIERCLPPAIRSKWQDTLKMDELPKLAELLTFIQTAIVKQQAFDDSHPTQRNAPKKRAGEQLTQPARKMSKSSGHTFVTAPTPKPAATPRNTLVCPMCQGFHRLFKCAKFNGLKVQDRWTFIRKIQACQNCLWKHPLPCDSDKRCKECHLEHHTLLHSGQGSNHSRNNQSTSTTENNA